MYNLKKHNSFIEGLLLKRFVFLAGPESMRRITPARARNTIRAKAELLKKDPRLTADQQSELKALLDDSYKAEREKKEEAGFKAAALLLKLLLKRRVKFVAAEEMAISPVKNEITRREEAARREREAETKKKREAASRREREAAEKVGKETEKIETIKMAKEVKTKMNKLLTFLLDDVSFLAKQVDAGKKAIKKMKTSFKNMGNEIVRKAEAGYSKGHCKDIVLAGLNRLIDKLETGNNGKRLFSNYSNVKSRLRKAQRDLSA